MKKFRVLLFNLHGFILLISFLSIGSMYAQGFSPATENRLRQVLLNFQNDPSFVGGISAAIKVDGLASWQNATGYAARNVDQQNNLLPGGTAFTSTTLSQIYSVTKTFTAALTLELSKQGAFSLNDPVSRYLPLNSINPGLNSSVTIRQLLAHESGYSDYTGEMQFLLSVAFQPTHIWSPFEVIYFVHQISAPGAVRSYSSTNYIILGALIEGITGKPIEQHYRERFFTPLNLTSMYLGVREPQPPGTLLASPHDNISAFNPIFQLTGQPTFPDVYTNISRLPFQGIISAAFSGGGIVSNAADLASWGNALFTGRATSRSTFDSMINSIPSTPDAQGDYLGYGIWKSTKMSNTETFLGHDGRAPGYRSVMFYQPDKKLTLVVLTNFYGADIYAIAKALYAALPEFTCGNKNRKENKIRVCYKNELLCIDRHAADVFLRKGAFLGDCDQPAAKAISNKIEISSSETFTAYPNPVTNKLNISFQTDQTELATIDLFDLNGKLVATLFTGTVQKGITKQISFEKPNLPTGTYIISLKTLTGIKKQKIVLIE